MEQFPCPRDGEEDFVQKEDNLVKPSRAEHLVEMAKASSGNGSSTIVLRAQAKNPTQTA